VTIRIETVTVEKLGRVLYAPNASFSDSQWLKERGWFFVWEKSPPDLQRRLYDAGIPRRTRWISENKLELAVDLASSDQVELSSDVASLLTDLARSQDLSKATDADLDIPRATGLEYRPYQRAGIQYALSNFQSGKKGVLIADEMGLGKTMQGIGIARSLDAEKILVVCPATLKVNWQREFQKWWDSEISVHVINGKAVDTTARVIIVNYDKVVGSSDRAKHIRETLSGMNFNLAILDESHMLKNPKAKRTAFFFGTWVKGRLKTEGLIHKVARCVLLTGTPIQNKVRESISLLKAIGAIGPEGTWQTESKFLFRYCAPEKTRWGWQFDGATHLDELQAKLRSSCMVRRLKVDVETELPPKLRSVVDLECSDSGLQSMPETWTDDIDRLIASAGSFEEISALRAEIAQAKAKGVCEYLSENIQGKAIVFAHHKVLLDEIEKQFPNSIRIDGSTPINKRQELVDRFQNDSEVELAILSTHAAGMGITLTAANTVVFAEADWNPSWCVQAEDRAHRIGQTATFVNVVYLTLDGTIDSHVIKTMVYKMNIADQALDRNRPKIEKPVEKKPVEKKPVEKKPVEKKPVEDTKVQIRNKKGTFEYTVNSEIKQVAAKAMLYLSGHCDGAVKKDNIGFNGKDARSEFVQSLVDRALDGIEYSDKQCAWALKILSTYKKTQISKFADQLYV